MQLGIALLDQMMRANDPFRCLRRVVFHMDSAKSRGLH